MEPSVKRLIDTAEFLDNVRLAEDHDLPVPYMYEQIARDIVTISLTQTLQDTKAEEMAVSRLNTLHQLQKLLDTTNQRKEND